MTPNFHVTLKSRPGANGEPKEENFQYTDCPYPSEAQPGELLIRTCYLSVDPALRCLMNEDSGVDYVGSWSLDETIKGSSGVGVVESSAVEGFAKGDLIQRIMGWPWKLYFKCNMHDKDHTYQKMDKTLFQGKPSLVMSLLTGLTALIGVWEKGHVTPGANQTIVVSGAAGACGSLAGQMARILGCSNVIGICGTQEKCEWIIKDLSFNGAINYKSDNISAKLQELCPEGIHVYFDNVGGDISDLVIKQMNADAHVILCGQISQYNSDVPYPPPISETIKDILRDKHITRERFLVLNYPHRFEEGTTQINKWFMSGELKVRETTAEGLENAAAAFVSMMKGGNIGKQLVHVSDP